VRLDERLLVARQAAFDQVDKMREWDVVRSNAHGPTFIISKSFPLF
jgi:hypothetical protein